MVALDIIWEEVTQMKLQLFARDDGTWGVVVRRTRPWEGPTASIYGVTDEDLPDVIERLVNQVDNEGKPSVSLGF